MLAWIRLSFLLFAALLLCLLPVQAQIHGVPASVTSLGFGGSSSPAPGVPASVTSLGPNGYGNIPSIFGGCCFDPLVFGHQRSSLFNSSHGHQNHLFFPGAVPVYSVPYTQVVVVQPGVSAEEEYEDYASDTTILDHRPSHSARLRKEYAEPEAEPESKTQSEAPAPAPEPAAQPNTVLIFKDGRKSEVQNYAIVGSTLIDFADGRAHKIHMADLDLPATEKANEDRGVEFRAPSKGAQ
jgi:hypothetical protein